MVDSISGPSSAPVLKPAPQGRREAGENSFQKTLESAQIHFSHHAQARMKQHQVNLSPRDMSRMSAGFQKAAQKGVQDALFLMDDKAFIVNVPGRVVVTSIHQARMKENVFTKIDSTVIL